jgi:small GTP-binding protein
MYIIKMKRSRTTDDKLPNNPKIVLLGDSNIGKSTLFHKINQIDNKDYQFPKRHCATDNFDFNRIDLSTNYGIVTIDLWDTAGQEEHIGGKLRDAYLKGADGILLLYDISDKKTIEKVPKWLNQVKTVTPNIPVAVIGNKSDKFDSLQQTEAVKLRETNLQRDIGHNKIKNFLISIKEDTHIETSTSIWTSSITNKTVPGCLIGLEYILTNVFNKIITIK